MTFQNCNPLPCAQANTLLPALENCLLELDAACNAGREGMCGKGDAWLIACAALLEHSIVLAKASSFLQLVCGSDLVHSLLESVCNGEVAGLCPLKAALLP